MNTPWMTVAEAAEYLRRSRVTVYRLMETGRLRSYKTGGTRTIAREDVDRYIKGCKA